MDTIVVVGGGGFLGRPLCSYLEAHYRVIVWDIDRDLFSLSADYLRQHQVSALVNLSVVADLSARFLTKDSQSWRVNIDGVNHIANCASESDAALIHFSTREVLGPVYGPGDIYEIPSGVFRPKWGVSESQAANPQHAYGQSKLVSEWLAQTSPYGYVVRLATPYTDDVPPQGGGLIPALIRGALGPNAVSLTQSGKQFRDPVHVADIASLVQRLVEVRPDSGIFNCGHGGKNLISLIEIVKAVKDDTLIESAAGGDLGFAFDTTRAEELLGWEPNIEIRQRLQDLVARAKTMLGAV